MRILFVVYDSGAHINWFPQGIAYLTSVLKKEGHEVELFFQDVHHYPDQYLTEYLNDHKRFDAIGISVIGGYWQYKKLLGLSKAINDSYKRPDLFVIGGHGPAAEPEYFLKKTNADVVCIGEGEETVKELFNSTFPMEKIDGIAYVRDGKVRINKRRTLISDIDAIPFPDYDEFPIEYYRLIRFPEVGSTDFCIPILSGRGCQFNCNFCYRMDEGFRARQSEYIIQEIEYLKSRWGINYILFSDELLMSSEKRTIKLCDDFIKAKLNIKWSCNGRLNYASDDVLKRMKEAGCVRINYGIESLDDTVLKTMKKALTVKIITRGIENTLKNGIVPGYNIIFGNIGETKEILDKGVEFLLKYNDGLEKRTVRPVTPYPGSPLYYYAIQKGLLKDCEDFYENKHVNSDLLSVNFTNLTDEDFHKSLMEANEKLLKHYYNCQFEKNKKDMQDLYVNKNVNFRGFR